MTRFFSGLLMVFSAAVLAASVVHAEGVRPAAKPVPRMTLELATSLLPTLKESALEKNQGRFYLVTLGATWCGACNALKENVKQWPADGKTSLSRVVWREIDLDKAGSGVFAELKELKLPYDGGIPATYIFLAGRYVVHFTGVLNLNRLNEVLGKAEGKLKEAKAGKRSY